MLRHSSDGTERKPVVPRGGVVWIAIATVLAVTVLAGFAGAAGPAPSSDGAVSLGYADASSPSPIVASHDEWEEPPEPSSVPNRSEPSSYDEMPYSTVGTVETEGGGQGTGVLVSPYHVLTAAHIVYDEGQLVDGVQFTPGYRDVHGEETEPFGEATADSGDIYLPDEYAEQGNQRHDFAIVKLDRPIGRQAGHMELGGWEGNPETYQLRQAGYPNFVAGQRQLTSRPTSLEVTGSGREAYLTYCAPASLGDSGSPIWRTVDGEPTVVGIHSGAGHTGCSVAYGFGARIGGEQLELVRSWINRSWQPKLNVTDVAITDNSSVGKPHRVNVDYENLGGPGEVDVALHSPRFSGLDHETVTVEPGETFGVTFQYTPTAEMVGQHEVIATSYPVGKRAGTAKKTVRVHEPLNLTLEGVPDTVLHSTESITVRGRVTNPGPFYREEQTILRVERKSVEAEYVGLAPGNSTNVTSTFTPPTSDREAFDVSLEAFHHAEPETTAARVSVAGPLNESFGGNAPRPHGEDGRYRDFDGNGDLSHADVIEFFSVQHRPSVQAYPAYFDFNGNGRVGHGDVVSLFQTVASQPL